MFCCAHNNRSSGIPNLLRNLRLAWSVIRSERPAAILTTGAGVAVPFAWIGRLLGEVRGCRLREGPRAERRRAADALVEEAAERVDVRG